MVYDEQLHCNSTQDMKYYNSHSATNRQKKHEKMSPTAKSKETSINENMVPKHYKKSTVQRRLASSKLMKNLSFDKCSPFCSQSHPHALHHSPQHTRTHTHTHYRHHQIFILHTNAIPLMHYTKRAQQRIDLCCVNPVDSVQLAEQIHFRKN